jgi:hypothetical protein
MRIVKWILQAALCPLAKRAASWGTIDHNYGVTVDESHVKDDD